MFIPGLSQIEYFLSNPTIFSMSGTRNANICKKDFLHWYFSVENTCTKPSYPFTVTIKSKERHVSLNVCLSDENLENEW